MRKISEVLRLRFELGLGQRAIARACSISQSTVHEYLNRAAAAGMVWPLGEEWDEQRVEQALFGERQVVKRLPEQVLPDFAALHSRVAATSPSDIAVGLGRVPAGASGRIRLQSLLRALPTVAREAGCSPSPGAQAWREGFRRLGRCNDSSARSGYRRSLASIAVRDGAGREFLHLCRSHPGPAVERLDQRSHSCL